jgi:hypothetical protein
MLAALLVIGGFGALALLFRTEAALKAVGALALLAGVAQSPAPLQGARSLAAFAGTFFRNHPNRKSRCRSKHSNARRPGCAAG